LKLSNPKSAIPNPKSNTSVTAYLDEYPSYPLSAFRGIGPDAPPTGVDDQGNLTFEQVPDFFRYLGVGPAPKVTGGDTGNLVFNLPGTPDSRAAQRYLRACDLLLNKDFQTTKASVQTGDGTTSIYTIQATFAGTPIKPKPYITQTANYDPAASAQDADPLSAATGGWTGNPTLTQQIATVYFVSPPGIGSGANPDGSWTPYVQHYLFWNLRFDTNALIPAKPPEAIDLTNNLAGGVGNAVISFLQSQINDQNSALSQYIANNQILGKFWTV
jgi:hypothetical protein